jgi:hypothetical protein
MRRNLFLIILMLYAGIGFSQSEKSIVSSLGFTNPGALIDGTSAFCYQYTGAHSEIVVKTDLFYMTSFTIDIHQNYSTYVRFYVSPDNKTYTYIGEVFDEFGEYTFNVGQDASFIKIVSDRGAGNMYVIELTELYVSGTQKKVYFTYDDAGNRKTRELIVSGIVDLKNTSEEQPQKFKLDGDTDILLYPNPTSGLLNFEVAVPEAGTGMEISAKVYSVTGSLVHDEKFNASAFNIDLTGEQNGTYLLDLTVNGKEKHFTIIKQ